MIRARDFSPLLGLVVCFLAASVALYTTASSLSSRLEDGYVFLSIFNKISFVSQCVLHVHVHVFNRFYVYVCMHVCYSIE